MTWMSRMVRVIKEKVIALHRRMLRIFAYRLVIHTGKAFAKDEASDRAAALAYYAMLSIFPLLLGLVSILGFFLPQESVRQTVSNALENALPASTSLIENNLNNIVRFSGLGTVVSVLLLLWTGSNLFSAMGRAVNRAWEIRKDRPLVRKKLLHLGMVLGVGILLLASMSLTVARDFLPKPDSPALSVLMDIGSIAVSLVLVFVVLLMILKLLPNRRTPWSVIWPGALLAAVLFEIAKNIFVWYLAYYASYDRVYGSLASIIILLFWIYLSSVILLLSVEFTAELEKMQQGKSDRQRLKVRDE